MICNKAHALFLQLSESVVQCITIAGCTTRLLLRRIKMANLPSVEKGAGHPKNSGLITLVAAQPAWMPNNE